MDGGEGVVQGMDGERLRLWTTVDHDPTRISLGRGTGIAVLNLRSTSHT